MRYFYYFGKSLLLAFILYSITRAWSDFRRISVGLEPYSQAWYDVGLFIMSLSGSLFIFYMKEKKKNGGLKTKGITISQFIKHPINFKAIFVSILILSSYKVLFGIVITSLKGDHIWQSWLAPERILVELIVSLPLLLYVTYSYYLNDSD